MLIKQKSIPPTEKDQSIINDPFILRELETGMQQLNIGKADGLDDICVGQILNMEDDAET